jgi:transaldolase
VLTGCQILDWHKAQNPGPSYEGDADPGVQSVKKIFTYYKQHGYKTIVMGASFRNVGEIKALAGVDFLTISPKLLEELKNSSEPVPKKLAAEQEISKQEKMDRVSFVDDEPEFRWALLQDRTAFDKLHEGITKFADSAVKLQEILKEKLQA